MSEVKSCRTLLDVMYCYFERPAARVSTLLDTVLRGMSASSCNVLTLVASRLLKGSGNISLVMTRMLSRPCSMKQAFTCRTCNAGLPPSSVYQCNILPQRIQGICQPYEPPASLKELQLSIDLAHHLRDGHHKSTHTTSAAMTTLKLVVSYKRQYSEKSYSLDSSRQADSQMHTVSSDQQVNSRRYSFCISIC
jgi:hypothetical protein